MTDDLQPPEAVEPAHEGWNAVSPSILEIDRPAPPPARPRHITHLALRLRMTQPERSAIKSARAADPVVDDVLDLMDAAQYVDLDAPLTAQGLALLVAAGLLTADRAAEVINAPMQDHERP